MTLQQLLLLLHLRNSVHSFSTDSTKPKAPLKEVAATTAAAIAVVAVPPTDERIRSQTRGSRIVVSARMGYSSLSSTALIIFASLKSRILLFLLSARSCSSIHSSQMLLLRLVFVSWLLLSTYYL